MGEIEAPPGLVRYDSDDPYLVVAADKGTATFSDEANEVSRARNFWLGDGFASGGSNGYDHKKMGITAKGAWVAYYRDLAKLNIENLKNSESFQQGLISGQQMLDLENNISTAEAVSNRWVQASNEMVSAWDQGFFAIALKPKPLHLHK